MCEISLIFVFDQRNHFSTLLSIDIICHCVILSLEMSVKHIWFNAVN